MRSRGERGTVAIVVALVLPIFVGLLALVVDLAHLYQVRNQLQNAADSAALAGVRDLDGQADRFPFARLSAQRYAGEHAANQTRVEIDVNDGNAADGDVVLGTWDFDARVFTAALAPAPRVNAVQVRTRRTSAAGGAVALFFAGIFGVREKGLTATAVAAGGSPKATCGFPLAVPACSLYDSSGNLRCNASMTFGRATSDNVGFTLISPDPPVNTPGINCMVAKALDFACPSAGGCDCSTRCNQSAIENGAIYISNGNNLSSQVVDWINQAVAAAGSAGLFVDVPVLDSGSLSNAECGSFQFNHAVPVVGYVKMRLTGADQGPPKTVTVSVDCTHTSPASPGSQGFFGYKSTNPYVVQ